MSKRKWTKDEIDEYRKMKGAFFYYNKDDSNLIVPKAFGIGWTVNWANPISWVSVIVIVGVAFLKYFM